MARKKDELTSTTGTDVLSKKIKAYKGFHVKDGKLFCRDFEFEEGKEYEESEAKLCEKGFHACENPLDCFGYYSPGESEYHEVELDEVSDEREDDSKVAAKKIKIGAKLSVADICKLHFEYVKERCNPAKSTAAGDKESASAGNYGAASAGEGGAASAGNYGAASAGEGGAASAGEGGAASAGEGGSASAGDYGSASAGEGGSASAGEGGAASAGEGGSAVSRGCVEVGDDGAGLVRGNNVKIRGGLGAILVIAIENDNNYGIKEYATAVVDGKKIKADTWYTLQNGVLTEVNK